MHPLKNKLGLRSNYLLLHDKSTSIIHSILNVLCVSTFRVHRFKTPTASRAVVVAHDHIKVRRCVI